MPREQVTMNLQNLFEQYLQHGKYLKGWSEKTPIVYTRAFTSFQQSLAAGCKGTICEDDAEINKAQLEAWVVCMRQKPLAPACINIYIRSLNSFCAWLKEEGHLKDEIKLKQVPAPLKPVTVLSESDVKAILSFRPRTFTDWRLWALVQTLLDTGCRINEILSLKIQDVDFDSMLLTVDGKGGKKRKVPFSPELRKLLWKYKQMVAKRFSGTLPALMFSTRTGHKIRYRNIYRDIIALCQSVGITKRIHCHLTRHTFACHFMKNGGSIYTLSRILGHSSVSTTQIYIRGLGVEDFHEEHARLSPLARLGGR